MAEAKQLWSWWQALLSVSAPVCTQPGWVRFVQGGTGLVLWWEEHTITQILTAVGWERRWRVLEHVAEYGAWSRDEVERRTRRLVEQERPARWGPYPPVALDDTKLHRPSAEGWGTCTFHEPSARSPNRAETVRAHNWVVLGDLVPGTPWTFLPQAARWYLRESQLPQEKPVGPSRSWESSCSGRPTPSGPHRCWRCSMGPRLWRAWSRRVCTLSTASGGSRF